MMEGILGKREEGICFGEKTKLKIGGERSGSMEERNGGGRRYVCKVIQKGGVKKRGKIA